MRKVMWIGVLVVAFGCSKSAPKVGVEMTPEDLSAAADLPLYDNAKIPDGASTAPARDDAGDMHYDIVQTTGDSPASVSKWYEKKTGWAAQGSNAQWSLMGLTKNGNEAIISIFKEEDYTKIVIKSIGHTKK